MTLLSVLGSQLAAGPAEGVVVWPHVGVILFGFLFIGLVGSLLGILAASRKTKVERGEACCGFDAEDRRLNHAA